MTEKEFVALLAVEGKGLLVFKNGKNRWCAHVHDIDEPPYKYGMTLAEASRHYATRRYSIQALIKRRYKHD